jgi:hypothetical protein
VLVYNAKFGKIAELSGAICVIRLNSQYTTWQAIQFLLSVIN